MGQSGLPRFRLCLLGAPARAAKSRRPHFADTFIGPAAVRKLIASWL